MMLTVSHKGNIDILGKQKSWWSHLPTVQAQGLGLGWDSTLIPLYNIVPQLHRPPPPPSHI